VALAATTTGGACRLSVDTNRIAVALGTDKLYYQAGMFNIERTHDAAGADTTEGLLIVTLSQGVVSQVSYAMTGGLGTAEATVGCLVPTAGAGTAGSAILLFPVFIQKGVLHNPCMNLLGYLSGAAAAGTQVSFTMYGATRKYMPLGDQLYMPTVRSRQVDVLLRDE
jgi:hypothetical protein